MKSSKFVPISSFSFVLRLQGSARFRLLLPSLSPFTELSIDIKKFF